MLWLRQSHHWRWHEFGFRFWFRFWFRLWLRLSFSLSLDNRGRLNQPDMNDEHPQFLVIVEPFAALPQPVEFPVQPLFGLAITGHVADEAQARKQNPKAVQSLRNISGIADLYKSPVVGFDEVDAASSRSAQRFFAAFTAICLRRAGESFAFRRATIACATAFLVFTLPFFFIPDHISLREHAPTFEG